MNTLPIKMESGRLLGRAPQPESYAEIREIAKIAVAAPQIKSWTNEEDCFMAILYGLDAGLSVSQAMSYVMVVNGRPSIWGEACVGLAIASGSFDHERYSQWFENEETPDVKAVCEMARIGGKVQKGEFSWKDAKKAGLDGKNTYKSFPKDMLAARARMRALKRAFPDVLAGLAIREEQEDARASGSVFEGDRPAIEPPPAQAAPEPPRLASEKPAVEKAPTTKPATAEALFEKGGPDASAE